MNERADTLANEAARNADANDPVDLDEPEQPPAEQPGLPLG